MYAGAIYYFTPNVQTKNSAKKHRCGRDIRTCITELSRLFQPGISGSPGVCGSSVRKTKLIRTWRRGYSANAASVIVVVIAATATVIIVVVVIAAAEQDDEQDNDYPAAAVTVTKVESTHSYTLLKK